jgi:outer membrane protein assembly factor BamB
VATTRGTVYAIQPGGLDLPGTQLWQYDVKSPVQGGLAVYNGVAYAGCADGHVYAIDILSQQLRWEYQASGPISGTIVGGGPGLVYFGTLDNQVYALKA